MGNPQHAASVHHPRGNYMILKRPWGDHASDQLEVPVKVGLVIEVHSAVNSVGGQLRRRSRCSTQNPKGAPRR